MVLGLKWSGHGQMPTFYGNCYGQGWNQSGRNEFILKRSFGYQTNKTTDAKIKFSNMTQVPPPSLITGSQNFRRLKEVMGFAEAAKGHVSELILGLSVPRTLLHSTTPALLPA